MLRRHFMINTDSSIPNVPNIPNDEIWYTSSDGQITPSDRTAFGANYLPDKSTFDSDTGKGILKFDGSVTSIGEDAFYGCSSLTSITISNSITSIVNSAFVGCTSLTSVTIDSDAIVNKTYTDGDNLYDIFGLQVTEYIIGDNVKGIGSYAFSHHDSLTSIIIGNSVTNIGHGAFYACQFLTSITIGNGVTSIENSAFYHCSSLTSITIPDSVTNIGNEVFGMVSAKLLFSKLYSTYTNKIIAIPTTSITYNIEFNISEIPTDYNISSMLPQQTENKGTITYNIYTDYAPCKDQALALVNEKTIVNVYHINGTPWT